MSVNSILLSFRISRLGASAMIELFEDSVILRIPATSAVFRTACVTKAVVFVTASDPVGKSFSVLESES